jgi:hypothetical protein
LLQNMRRGRSIVEKLIFCGLFAVAFAYMEGAVVVYLRRLFYPQGFSFPLDSIPQLIVFIEAGREAATILILYALARLAGSGARQRVSYFLYSFGVWDIFYYIWLKILLGWPSGLLDWDVLFLIPLPWVGPVLSPLVVSVFLVAVALAILILESRNRALKLSPAERLLEIAAAVPVVASYLWETGKVLRGEEPRNYPWWLLALGLFLAAGVLARRLFSRRWRQGG